MSFNARQVKQLLAPIRPERVLRDGKGHNHVSQQDVTAHLIRVFGFGSFDTEVLAVECVFEQERVNSKSGAPTGRWDVCYRALLRLTIRDEHGQQVCQFEDGSTATAQNQVRGDAHDLAYKSALSLAKKRAAINLGDQFGLSLYNGGQIAPLVLGTLVRPVDDESDQSDHADVQDGVAQQISLGNDETDQSVTEINQQRKALLDQLVELAKSRRVKVERVQAKWFDQYGHDILTTTDIGALELFRDELRAYHPQENVA